MTRSKTNGSRHSDPNEDMMHRKTHNDDRKQGLHYALEKEDAH
jgi:hypothetical protein